MLAGLLACSQLSGMSSAVYANSAGATTEETDTVDNSVNKVLKDEHGRIVLWKWQKVTQGNANELLNDGKFHPSMLVRLDNSGNPVGFVSTYADQEHIFRGRDSRWYKTEFKLNTSMADSVGYVNAYNQMDNYFIRMDEDGKSLNGKVNFGDSVFYSQGGTMGVPYIKATNLGNNLRTKLKNRNTYRIDTNIVLARGSEKNSGDVSFYEKMEGTFSDEDYFIEKYWWTTGGETMEPFTAIVKPGDSHWGDRYQFCFQPFGAESGGRGDTWVIKADLNEEDDSDLDGLDYAISNYWQSDSPSDIGGFSTTLVTASGYLVAMDVRRYGANGPVIDASSYGIGARAHTSGRNIYDISLSGAEARFMWYVGTPYTFASLKGQGGDETTGEGGTTTIGRGELLEIDSAEYMDVNNHLQKSDGVILPEGAKIIVNEGGVLAVTTNLISNGRIINNGGTVIIKAGGSISPFLETNQGSIECMNGGNIVVMPNGRLFCLSDAYNRYTDPRQIASLRLIGLKLTGGSTLINYGLFANSYCQIDQGSTIENRGEGIVMAAVKRDSINKLLYNASINKNGDYTTVEGLSPIDGANCIIKIARPLGVHDEIFCMYYGITCQQCYDGTGASVFTYNMDNGGTLKCDSTATLVRYVYSKKYTDNQSDGKKYYYDAVRLVKVVTPDY